MITNISKETLIESFEKFREMINNYRQTCRQNTAEQNSKEPNCSEQQNVLQAFLNISPISLMLDIGNQIIERKRKRVNHDLLEPFTELTKKQKENVRKRMKPPYIGYLYKVRNGKVVYRVSDST